MSILNKFDNFNENCVVCFEHEGDERIFMPLCGESDCLPGYTIARNNSPEWVFEYIVRGRGSFRCGEDQFHPEAGDLYIAPQGSNHVYASCDKDPWFKIWFNIQGSLVAELACFYGISDLLYLPDCGLETVFQECLAAMRTHTENAKETATLVTHKLIYHIATARRGNVSPSERATRIRRVLDAHLTDGATFETIAAELPGSPIHLARIFRSAYGETPYAYLLNRRLELARSMLRNSTLTVKEIASRTGFSDPYYFSNIFKRKTGLSPRAYRIR